MPNPSTQKNKFQKDYFGLVFTFAEGLGAYPSIVYGKLTEEADQPQWFFLPHSKYDGIGGFCYLLEQEGYEIDEVPELKNKQPPSFWKKLLLFLELLKEESLEAFGYKKHIPWKNYDDSKLTQGKPLTTCWHVFTTDETLAIINAAKRNNVTVNSFLLWTLNQSVKKELVKDADSDIKWWIPINMRGAVTNGYYTANHSSILKLKIPHLDTLEDLHHRISADLKRQSYWASWWLGNIPKLFGIWIIKASLKKQFFTGRNFAGAFSNLGQLSYLKPNPINESWLFGPPTLPSLPVAAGCLTWDNKLALTLQIHQVLASNPEITKACFNAWLSNIKNSLA